MESRFRLAWHSSPAFLTRSRKQDLANQSKPCSWPAGERVLLQAGPGGAYPEAIQRPAFENRRTPCGCEPRKSRTARAVACACASRMPAYLPTDILGRDARRSCEAPRGRKISLDA